MVLDRVKSSGVSRVKSSGVRQSKITKCSLLATLGGKGLTLYHLDCPKLRSLCYFTLSRLSLWVQGKGLAVSGDKSLGTGLGKALFSHVWLAMDFVKP